MVSNGIDVAATLGRKLAGDRPAISWRSSRSYRHRCVQLRIPRKIFREVPQFS